MDWINLAVTLVKIVVLTFMVLLPMIAYSVWAERRVAAKIQNRVGPNRTGLGFLSYWFPFTKFGLFGLGQPIADGLKFIFKEDFTPAHVRTGFFWLAPALTMVPALMTCAVIPFGSELNIAGYKIPLVIADLNVGPLFIFAIASLSVYGIVLAGWASNSKYSFLGGVRSTSQMISYEISLGLSIVPILMIFGELNLTEIVKWQDSNGWLLFPFWGGGEFWQELLLLVPVSISFLIFTVSMFAETNRLPFDLPECETELVAGYHTEYSSMKFALFFLGEYAAMIIGSGLAVTLFLGGWSLPFGIGSDLVDKPLWLGIAHFFCFLTKMICFILLFIWVRWSLPRFRYDQLMRLGWVFFFEIALANVFLTALILIYFN